MPRSAPGGSSRCRPPPGAAPGHGPTPLRPWGAPCQGEGGGAGVERGGPAVGPRLVLGGGGGSAAAAAGGRDGSGGRRERGGCARRGGGRAQSTPAGVPRGPLPPASCSRLPGSHSGVGTAGDRGRRQRRGHGEGRGGGGQEKEGLAEGRDICPPAPALCRAATSPLGCSPPSKFVLRAWGAKEQSSPTKKNNHAKWHSPRQGPLPLPGHCPPCSPPTERIEDCTHVPPKHVYPKYLPALC